jgi:hypothetical protein
MSRGIQGENNNNKKNNLVPRRMGKRKMMIKGYKAPVGMERKVFVIYCTVLWAQLIIMVYVSKRLRRICQRGCFQLRGCCLPEESDRSSLFKKALFLYCI